MAKPIFIIALPGRDSKNIENVRNAFIKNLYDYHIVVYNDSSIPGVEFKVIAEKDFDHINVEDEGVRKVLTDYISKLKK